MARTLNALFAFDDPAVAHRAARRLAGVLPEKAVVVHAKDAPPNETLVDKADEQVSGGLLRNLVDLWQGVFEWGESPHETADYEETVRNGGAVVSVDAKTLAEQQGADDAMQDSGFRQRTGWA